jgi:outer membrane protein OmpA-like peptidoglycan-associated protein
MKINLKAMALAFAAGVIATTAVAAQDKQMGERYHWYISGGGGLNVLQDDDSALLTTSVPAGTTFPVGFNFDLGSAAAGAVGAFLPYAFRIEVEGAYRENKFDTTSFTFTPPPGAFFIPPITSSASGKVKGWSVMANILKDFPLGSGVTPYIGGGAGMARRHLDMACVAPISCTLSDSDTNFAYQGIAGISFDLTDNLQAFADYRYFVVEKPAYLDETTLAAVSNLKDQSHTGMIGLRLAFGKKGAPAPAAAPQPKNYLVFFDFDHSDLTEDGKGVIATAAKDAIDGKAVSLDVVGHADRSGSDDYNMGLSERRANTVKGELVSLGVPESAISITWKGESEPLVATADGVREPQNRRASIAINFGQ